MATTSPDNQAIDEFLSLRNSWKLAGCPSDHPYLTDAAERLAEDPTPAVPLAIQLSDGQMDAVRRAAPIFKAMSDANVAEILR